ncbi:MAG: response regulator, partial [Mariprofundaceae bacterium]|nr:response regulator [Mariprofundaceae bacterium]
PSERLRLRRSLLKTIDTMEKEHDSLISKTLQKFSPRIRAMYFAAPLFADSQVKTFLQAGRTLAHAKATALHANNSDLLAIWKAADGSLLDALNAIVRQYQKESEDHIRAVQYQGLGITLLILAVMLLMVLFLFRPIVRRMRESANELAASEALHRGAMEGMVDGVIVIDAHGIVESFNPAAERIFGYTPDEVIGNNVKMLMPEPYKHEHDGYLKHYLDTGEAKIIGIGRIVEGKRKDGATFPLDLAVSEMISGEARQFIGAVRDITERVAAEQAIADKTEALALRGRYDQSYARAMALFSSSYNQEKALSGLLSILADHHPYPASAIYIYEEWSCTLKLAASHGAPETLKKEFERGEGLIGQTALENKITLLELGEKTGMTIETGLLTFNPAAVIASPICYQEKTVGVLALASSKPLTDLDRSFIERLCGQIGVAMNNLRQHRDLMDLAEQLRQRGEEVTQQNQQLEQANRMKSEFLANMSHELRTPLNAIIGFSEVLKDGVMGELTREQTEYIGDIFNSGQHLLSLINDILDLSKIEAGKMELDLEETNVPDLLNNSLSIIKEKAMAHHIKLSQDIGDGVENCWMDARKAKQIVFNLLSNAVKFTPDGGSVRVRARKVKGGEKGDGSLSFPAKPETGKSETVPFFLEISVTDTGIGISEADQKKLFNAFVQADSSLSRKFEGTGLGLVMVKRLTELHGGTVGMQSEEGKGSTFTAWLPYRTEGKKGDSLLSSERKSETVPFFPRPDPDSLTVLIVEDEEAAAELMRVQLETEGYSTTRAASAEQALEMLTKAKAKPDLITLDILLPGMDGWDFLAEIKKDKALVHIPVVIVSIIADGNERKGFSLGASQVLQKPVRKQALLTAVGDAGLGLDGGISGTVLVVDDDPKAVEVVASHLESSSATVLRAYGGAEAIDIAKSKKPDLIILDLMMPEVTGFDVVDMLKQREDTAHIPIIILTAKVITDADRKALNGGVLKIVEKSGFNHGSFISEVRRAAGKLAAKSAQPAPKTARKKASGVKKSATAAMVTPADKATVLVVEDNAKASHLLKRYLEDAGYAVMQAGNGAVALELMAERKPGLITLDMMMPDMDGLEFLNEKANLPECLNIPVLIVSGVDDASKGLSLGTNAIVRKPIKKREFLDIVGSLGIDQTGDVKPTVLVVDDDPKAVKTISSYFEAEAFHVVKTYGGAEALDSVRQGAPDLIVLDLMMPDVDGFEVIHRLKKDKKTRGIPIIVLTAKTLTRDARRELMDHVQAIEEKGRFDRDHFLVEVSSLLKDRKP